MPELEPRTTRHRCWRSHLSFRILKVEGGKFPQSGFSLELKYLLLITVFDEPKKGPITFKYKKINKK